MPETDPTEPLSLDPASPPLLPATPAASTPDIPPSDDSPNAEDVPDPKSPREANTPPKSATATERREAEARQSGWQRALAPALRASVRRLSSVRRMPVAVVAVATALLLAMVVLSSLGMQHWGWLGFAGSRAQLATVTPTHTATAVPTPTETPVPTATPNPNLQRNAEMGCAGGEPTSSPKVIFGTKDYETGGTAPPEVALTFDDGPTPYTSPPILDYLEQTHTPATFFVLGLYARSWPYLIQREWRDGFAIGVHSWDHPMMSIVSDGQMAHQFGDTIAAIHAAIGQDACIWFWRPPYGDFNSRVVGFAQSYGLTTIQWNADPADWSRPGVDVIASRVLAQARPGSIILMHDGPARREQTLAALPQILAGLRERGLTPVTLPQLLSDSHYPGVVIMPKRPPNHELDTPVHPALPGAAPAADVPILPPDANSGE